MASPKKPRTPSSIELIRPFRPVYLTPEATRFLFETYSKVAEEIDDILGEGSVWKINVSDAPGGAGWRVRVLNNSLGMSLSRDFDDKSRTIHHTYFTLAKKLQSKGLAGPVMRATVALREAFNIKTVALDANLDVGGYAWFRKGFLPKVWGGRSLAETIANIPKQNMSMAVRDALRAELDGMDEAAVRRFVMGPEFRKYKEYFLGTYWSSEGDLDDPLVRAALSGEELPTAAPAARESEVIAHSVQLERLKAAEVRDYNRLTVLLQQQVDELVQQLAGAPLSSLTRAQFNARLRLLRQSQKAVLDQANTRLTSRLRLLAEYEAEFEAAALNRLLTEAGLAAQITTPTAAAAWALANTQPLSATGDLLGPWVNDMTAAEVELINKALLRGYSEGWTNDQLVTMLKGTKALGYSDGLLSRMGKHNATIVRTAMQHVASTAREQVWRDNSELVERYRWVSTLDSRTSTSCRSLDGQEFEIGKGPRPPIHPNCRSTTVAVIPGLESFYDEITRASADGQVRGSMTYYEWLDGQPAAVQDNVLGPSRGKIFRQPGMTADKFAKLQLNSAFEPLTLEELRKLLPRG